MTRMDASIRLSDEALGELLLDNAKLGDLEKQLVRTTVRNNIKFEYVKLALEGQFAAKHKNEHKHNDFKPR